MMAKDKLLSLISNIYSNKRVLSPYRKFTNLYRNNHGAVIVNFHHLFNTENDFLQKGPSVQTHVNDFEELLNLLLLRFMPISLDNLVRHLHENTKLPEDSFIITFDDGYLNNHKYALPILKKYGLRATIFLATGFIGTNNLMPMDKIDYLLRYTNKKSLLFDLLGNEKFSLLNMDDKIKINSILGSKIKKQNFEYLDNIFNELSEKLDVKIKYDNRIMLNWSEVKQMISDNIDIGSHAVSHICMTRLSEKDAVNELVKSKEDILFNTSYIAKHFAFPNGMKEDFNENLRQSAINIGYQSISSVERGVNYPGLTSPFHLKRVGMYKNPKRTILNIENYFLKSHFNA